MNIPKYRTCDHGDKGITCNCSDAGRIHAGHCCVNHGCKYNDDECPVLLGTVLQRRPCESCYDQTTSTKYKIDDTPNKIAFESLKIRVIELEEENKQLKELADDIIAEWGIFEKYNRKMEREIDALEELLNDYVKITKFYQTTR